MALKSVAVRAGEGAEIVGGLGGSLARSCVAGTQKREAKDAKLACRSLSSA